MQSMCFGENISEWKIKGPKMMGLSVVKKNQLGREKAIVPNEILGIHPPHEGLTQEGKLGEEKKRKSIHLTLFPTKCC